VVMAAGRKRDSGPAASGGSRPGNAPWVVGDEPCVVIDWQGFADYAKR